MTEEIFPTRWRANVSIAEPKPPLEADSLTRTLDPKECRHDRRIALNTDRLCPRLLILYFIHNEFISRCLELLFASGHSPITKDQDHVLVQNSRHCLCVVAFYGSLKFDIELTDTLTILHGVMLVCDTPVAVDFAQSDSQPEEEPAFTSRHPAHDGQGFRKNRAGGRRPPPQNPHNHQFFF